MTVARSWATSLGILVSVCGYARVVDSVLLSAIAISPWSLNAHVLCVDTGRSSETAKAHRG
eukprot:TRINITY_DN8995_c0_g1_i1.p3 TRINITY_DN8995_c0_g1~~TRINITY_DN8995_c0_g1_i1.p3  ORF type:complete len:61 (+),score=15.58 TRINITY_DN8995_c0_g1_i1:111-293(+)